MHSPAQVLMDLTDKMTALLTATVVTADQAQHDAEVAQLKLDIARAKEDLAAEGIRMAAARAALDAQTQLIQAQSFWLTMDQNFAAIPSFVPMTSHRPKKPNLFISYKMDGLGAVPMATVFRTPLIFPTGLEYSWPEHKQRFILR